MVERVGQQLGNYRLTGSLGQGGFAKVYLGEHIYLQTKAAIKVLQALLSGPDDIDSFLNEAKIIAHLTHPHIVRVLDFGIDSETPFLVMDYAPNGTLRQRHPKRTQLSLPTIVSYVKQIADALQYSHDERLIHRDIKPENMLIGQRNEVLLSDFGIALVTQSSRYHSTQAVVGTAPYMSPEQIQGKARPVSDQYSLGIVVYEWLSGDRPFQGTFVELCTQHLFTPVPPLREKVPTILPEVEQVVLKALAKDPKQRFGSVQAFADALEQASQLVPKSSPLSDAFSLNRQAPASKEQVAIKIVAKADQHSDSANASEQSNESKSEAMISPSLSSSDGASMSPLAPTLFAQSSPVSNAFSLNLQQSSKGQAVRQVSQTKRKYPESADTTINILKRARRHGASLAQIAPKNTNWGLSQQEIILIILGISIFSILNYYADQLIIHNSILFNGSIANLPYLPSYGDLLLRGTAFAFALFLGVKFGPWAGCVCVFIGSFSGDVLTGYILHAQWYQYMADMLAVLISGVSTLSTYGRYNTSKCICTAVIMSLLGIFTGSYFLVSIDSMTHGFFAINFISEFIILMNTKIIGSIIPLIILLMVNESFVHHEEQKVHRVSGAKASETVTGIEHL